MPANQTSTADRIAGSNQMASLIRGFAWETTALGPLAGWSSSLLAAINFTLASPVSTIVMIGPGLFTLYNDAYIPTLADRHPRALGMPGNVLWADAWEAVGHQIEAVLATGTAFKFDNVLIPVERNGVTTDTYFTYSFSPLFESEAAAAAGTGILGVLCMAQDVTAAHQAMLDLAESERKLARAAADLHQMMSVTTDLVVSMDREWRFTYFNPAAERLYSPGRSLIGKKLWDEFPDAYFPGSPYVEHYERAMHQGIASTFEAYYPEPLDMWLRINVYPAPEGFITFSRDITEERRTATVLLQTEKLAAVGRLASSIAHEINNPLEAITNLLYIARGEPDLHNVRRLLEMADDELRRVSVIANQTLGFHKQQSRPREMTCDELFQGALAVYQSKLKNSRIETETSRCSPDRIAVYEGEIRQVLNNLFSNAIDAMPHGGRLEMRSRSGTDPRTGRRGLFLSVADTGSGIPPEKRARVFEAFYTTKGIGGTGLGLWISRDILARHHGTLHMRSSQSERHHGTVFSMFIPFENPAVEALHARANAASD